MPDTSRFVSLIRRKAHELNNLIMIIEGNMEMMCCDDDEIISDNLESLQECKEIIKFLLSLGKE